MDYQIAVREDKGLEVGTPPPLIQGEKGVDRLVFTLPDPYRGMALDDFSFGGGFSADFSDDFRTGFSSSSGEDYQF